MTNTVVVSDPAKAAGVSFLEIGPPPKEATRGNIEEDLFLPPSPSGLHKTSRPQPGPGGWRRARPAFAHARAAGQEPSHLPAAIYIVRA